jgi:glycosyltransferase 2 family protein
MARSTRGRRRGDALRFGLKPHTNRKTKQPLFLVVGLVISAGFIWYFSRAIQWRDFVDAFARFRLVWLFPAAVCFFVSVYLRAVRWGLLFRPHHTIGGRQAFPALMIGFALNNVLPSGRVGELVRAVYMGRRFQTGIPTAFATVVAERILDALTLLVLLAVAFALMPPIPPDFEMPEVMGFYLSADRLNRLIGSLAWISAALSVGVATFMFPRVQLTLIRLARRLRVLPARSRRLLALSVRQFARGFHALAGPATMVRILGYSLAVWLLIAMSFLMIGYGFDRIEMSLIQAVALVALVAIFIMIPAAPGYWGLFEAGCIFSLFVMGITGDISLALAYGLINHVLQFVPIVIVGLYYSWRAQVRPLEERHKIGETV